ncbi:velvet factor [Globomyces pollinis-pini]|nr:velvet factor [Globomyces pollinis-pini]
MITSHCLEELHTTSLLEDSHSDSLSEYAANEEKQLIPTPTTLEIIQNPRQARACGYGKGDYRSIDPPPIVKVLDTANQSQNTNNDWIVCVTLWSVDDDGNLDKDLTKSRLVGNTVGESRYLHDLTDQPGTYFIFPSLSIRLPGLYKLQYRLIQVFSPDRLSLLPSTEVISTIFSDSFRAYTSKTFPGKSKPTILMRFLARQTSDIKSRNL